MTAAAHGSQADRQLGASRLTRAVIATRGD
jgi:hypothetical protein